MTPSLNLVYVGIGSNLEDPRRQLEAAFEELQRLPHTRLVRRSSLYQSKPLGYANQPDFINAVAALETSLEPAELLHELQILEARHGRERSFRNAPRTLDLDLLLYGERVSTAPDLTLPHPRMHERAFVLKPLLEIAPRVSIPGRGPALDCLRACANQAVDRLG